MIPATSPTKALSSKVTLDVSLRPDMLVTYISEVIVTY